MQITSKGQVTIPLEIRSQFGFLPHTEVEFVVKGNHVILEKKSTKNMKNALKAMRGCADTGLSTDEIMQLTRGK